MSPVFLLSFALVGSVASGPSVFWVSQPVKSGQTVLAYGSDLSGVKNVQLDGQGTGASEVRQSFDHSVAFTLAGTGSYPVVGANISAEGGSTHIWVNRPTPWWSQEPNGQEIRAGGLLNIYGTALGTDDTKTSVTLKVNGKTWQVQPTRADLYSLQITLPADLPAGNDTLIVNRAGFDSDPIDVTVVATTPDSFSGQVNATEFGVVANGNKDDTEALQKAIDQAAATHKSLILPAGSIHLKSGITIPSHSSVSGIAEGRTLLVFDISDKAPPALVDLEPYSSLKNLTVFGTNYINGISGGGADGTGHVTVQNVRVRLDPYMGHIKPEDVGTQIVRDAPVKDGGIDSMYFHGPNIDVEGCDVDGAGVSIIMDRVLDSVVRGNHFVNGRWGWYSIRISSRVIFQDNSVTGGDLMSAGGGINSKFGTENVYFDHNTFNRFYGWDREGMTSDAPGGGYYGPIGAVRGQDLDLPETVKGGVARWKDGAVFILGGKGQGQYRIVRNVADKTVTLDRPWTVEPDSTSIVSITPIVRHLLLLNNSFTDTGVGIQLYGGSVDVIGSGNTSTRSLGFMTCGRNYGGGIEPSWYVQWLGNTVNEPVDFAGTGVASATTHEGGVACVAYNPHQQPLAPLVLGNVMRENQVTSDGSIHLGWLGLNSSGGDFVEDCLVEKNSVKDSPIGVHIGPACRRIVVLDNNCSGCAKELVDERQAEKN